MKAGRGCRTRYRRIGESIKAAIGNDMPRKNNKKCYEED